MPNIKSAMKRMRSDAKKRAVNQAALSQLKTLSQQLGELESDPKKAKDFARRVISRYDKAVSRGIIPKGRADRKKTRVEKFLVKISKQ
ncbi:MAG: 30S ribosomal protein S20 [Candidatus Omnitrophota bacterium]|nr:30S ribosomal protein S20 [Candidatus Omnitrophota bacterium]